MSSPAHTLPFINTHFYDIHTLLHLIPLLRCTTIYHPPTLRISLLKSKLYTLSQNYTVALCTVTHSLPIKWLHLCPSSFHTLYCTLHHPVLLLYTQLYTNCDTALPALQTNTHSSPSHICLAFARILLFYILLHTPALYTKTHFHPTLSHSIFQHMQRENHLLHTTTHCCHTHYYILLSYTPVAHKRIYKHVP